MQTLERQRDRLEKMTASATPEGLFLKDVVKEFKGAVGGTIEGDGHVHGFPAAEIKKLFRDHHALYGMLGTDDKEFYSARASDDRATKRQKRDDDLRQVEEDIEKLKSGENSMQIARRSALVRADFHKIKCIGCERCGTATTSSSIKQASRRSAKKLSQCQSSPKRICRRCTKASPTRPPST